ncbi:MAG: hypothetical protein HY000_11150 [Planctomycetes bacterium]|nr:hypothetical protein [Planctomycetota bacterium]
MSGGLLTNTSNAAKRQPRTAVFRLPSWIVCLFCLVTGCKSLPAPRVPGPPPSPPQPVADARPAPPPQDANLSGALDGPTLRLALYDLAIIFDTLGRLEQIRPDLKSQMLAELAEADATTAAAVVKRWRERLVELQQAADDIRTVSAQMAVAPAPAAGQKRTERAAEGSLPNVPLQPVPEPPKDLDLLPESVTNQQSVPARRDNQRSAISNPSPLAAKWDDQLRAMLNQARERAKTSDPEEARARVQLALMELLWQSEQNRKQPVPVDANLLRELTPAIEYALGTDPAVGQSSQAANEALGRAAERLRGPPRFEARNLTFCKRIRGFGSIERVEAAAFSCGQAVLLYNEVDGFLSEPGSGRFRSRLSSELELLDADGQTVWQQQFAAVEDSNSVARRDYFLSHSFRLPALVRPGTYLLRLTLHDELAKRSTSATVPLVVR